jgi:hypothetical protein
MKVQIFFSTLFRRWVSRLSVHREGNSIDCQKWDNMYDSVIGGRMERYTSK